MAAAVMAGAIVIARPASAQDPRFQIVDIHTIDFDTDGTFPDLTTEGPIGLNNKDQVVYARLLTSGRKVAFVYLPAGDYGMLSGRYNLYELTPNDTESNHTIARDINEDGIIVGEHSDSYNFHSGFGAVWDLAADDFVSIPAWEEEDSYSTAYGVNDDEEPVIVGDSLEFDLCTCNGFGNVRIRTFQTSYDSGTVDALSDLVPPSTSKLSFARDVNTPTGEDPQTVAGYTFCWGSLEQGACPETLTDCDSLAATRWENGTGTFVDEGDGDTYAQLRAVNEAGECAGFASVTVNQQFGVCKRIAHYFPPDSQDPPTPLCSTMPCPNDLEEANRTWAEGMNNWEYPQVVGFDVDATSAKLWEMQSNDTFTVLDLNSTEAIGPTAANIYDILQAHAVNDNGIIACWAQRTVMIGQTQLTLDLVILLIPYGESGNANGLGGVDEDDLAITIANLGNEAEEGARLFGDVNNDFIVDLADLAIVMGNFGAPSASEEAVSEEWIAAWLEAGGGNAIESESLGAAALAEALAESSETARVAALFALISQ